MIEKMHYQDFNENKDDDFRPNDIVDEENSEEEENKFEEKTAQGVGMSERSGEVEEPVSNAVSIPETANEVRAILPQT